MNLAFKLAQMDPSLPRLPGSLQVNRQLGQWLKFHADGTYAGFDDSCPTCKTKGKNVVARRLRAEHRATHVVMVGDGASDLEVKGDADVVIGFGRYVQRPKVVAGADKFVHSLEELVGVV